MNICRNCKFWKEFDSIREPAVFGYCEVSTNKNKTITLDIDSCIKFQINKKTTKLNRD